MLHGMVRARRNYLKSLKLGAAKIFLAYFFVVVKIVLALSPKFKLNLKRSDDSDSDNFGVFKGHTLSGLQPKIHT